jgi:DDE superfamily endonuclease
VSGDPLESPKTSPARPPTRRSGHGLLARGHLAGAEKGAQAQPQRIFFIDESGFYPLPSVVRTYAPVGHTPILREWWTRDHLSVIAGSSPEGKLYFHSQDHALDSTGVVGFREHLLRQVSGRMVIIWDGAPIHRSHRIQDFLANGAAERLHLERLPAYAPELNPGEGLGNSSKASSYAMCAASTSHISVWSCVMLSNGSGENRASFKASFGEQNFSFQCPGQ